ncbi:hypothetical protein LCGC14_0386050 [marine sediment metagenome]|uniref:Uncharacterized protein n=1 Tax=marine sediment metagenome TaxID=412755 RepID=A0A0F9VN13_9ZZZZ
MIIDKQLLLDDELDIGAGGGSQASTFSVDLGVAKNIAAGRPMYVVVVIDETFDGGTSLKIDIVTDTVATLASPTTHVGTMAILQTDLAAGREPIVIPIGQIDSDRERYLGLYYTDVGTFSAGKVTAFITMDPQSNFGG